MKKKRELVREIGDAKAVAAALIWAEDMILQALRGGSVMLRLGRPSRTLDQNAKMWPMLTDIAKQVDWFVIEAGGELVKTKLTPEEWKDVLTASLEKQRMVPGVDGGFVYTGSHTSRMNKAEFSELIELIAAFGAAHGVRWSEPSNEAQRNLRNKVAA